MNTLFSAPDPTASCGPSSNSFSNGLKDLTSRIDRGGETRWLDGKQGSSASESGAGGQPAQQSFRLTPNTRQPFLVGGGSGGRAGSSSSPATAATRSQNTHLPPHQSHHQHHPRLSDNLGSSRATTDRWREEHLVNHSGGHGPNQDPTARAATWIQAGQTMGSDFKGKGRSVSSSPSAHEWTTQFGQYQQSHQNQHQQALPRQPLTSHSAGPVYQSYTPHSHLQPFSSSFSFAPFHSNSFPMQSMHQSAPAFQMVDGNDVPAFSHHQADTWDQAFLSTLDLSQRSEAGPITQQPPPIPSSMSGGNTSTQEEEMQYRLRSDQMSSLSSSARESIEAERESFLGCSSFPFAVPSIAEPRFDDEGRLARDGLRQGGNVEGQDAMTDAAKSQGDAEGRWDDVFDSAQRGAFVENGQSQMRRAGAGGVERNVHFAKSGASDIGERIMAVPQTLQEAISISRGEHKQHGTTLVEDSSNDIVQNDDDEFENALFASYYGSTHIARPTEAALVRHLSEPSVTLETEHLRYLESDLELDQVRRQESRIAGYPMISKQGGAAERIDETQRNGRYLFQSRNPYLVNQGQVSQEDIPAEYGLEYLNVLQHEAAVLANPSDPQAWFSLGIKQQENERDDQAIHALLQCISIDPSLRPAYLALSVSYTNEMLLKEAHDVLESWVDVVRHREPSSTTGAQSNAASRIVEQGLGSGLDAETEVTRDTRHRYLASELISMVQTNQTDEVDADVQIALGVLFNASEEYEKAQDCFRTALQVRPDDWLLWNRLGAVLANGSRAEDALSCYQEALRLYPGYIRAIFNIGIAYVKLSKYAQAGQYIVAALDLQHSEASNGSNNAPKQEERAAEQRPNQGYPMAVDAGYPFQRQPRNALRGGIRGLTSDTLWQSLRTVVVHMNRPDLLADCDDRNLTAFHNVFDRTTLD